MTFIDQSCEYEQSIIVDNLEIILGNQMQVRSSCEKGSKVTVQDTNFKNREVHQYLLRIQLTDLSGDQTQIKNPTTSLTWKSGYSDTQNYETGLAMCLGECPSFPVPKPIYRDTDQREADLCNTVATRLPMLNTNGLTFSTDGCSATPTSWDSSNNHQIPPQSMGMVVLSNIVVKLGK